MSTLRRPIQDRRALSREKINLPCQFTFEGIEYDAYIGDISLKGAFLWSTFMPPWGAGLSVRIGTPLLENPLILEGKIVRRDCKQTERGTVGAFVIRFSSSSPALIVLISKLIKPQRA